MDTTYNNIKQLIDYYKTQKKLTVIAIKAQLLTEFKVILKNNPNIIEFGWTQYTPLFNDGDPCVLTYSGLGVNDSSRSIEDEDEDWITYGLDPQHSDFIVLNRLLEGIPIEILEDLFGNGTKVVVDRESGITISEYEGEY